MFLAYLVVGEMILDSKDFHFSVMIFFLKSLLFYKNPFIFNLILYTTKKGIIYLQNWSFYVA